MERDVKTAAADREAALAQVDDLRKTLTGRDTTVVDLEAQVARRTDSLLQIETAVVSELDRLTELSTTPTPAATPEIEPIEEQE
jgi:hypothetical protein